MIQNDKSITNLYSRDRQLILEEDNNLGLGGEGTVYRVLNSKDLAVKIYHDAERASSLQEKIIALCNLNPRLPDNAICPIEPVFDHNISPPIFRGFTMKYIKNAKTLDKFKWNKDRNIKDVSFDSHTANILYDICDGLKSIHRARIVIGDLKPENIIVANGCAYFIDFDSVNIISFGQYGPATLNYLDPRLRRYDPNASGPFLFDVQSDWWALGVIAFELFLGHHPWQGRSTTLRNIPVRSFNYSAFYFDNEVKPPINARSKDWFNGKDRLKAFFEQIFSDHDTPRPYLDFALLSCFEKIDANDRTPMEAIDVDNLVEGILITKESLKEIINVTSGMMTADFNESELKKQRLDLLRILAA